MTMPSVRRIDRLPGGVGGLVERVPQAAIDECLGLIMATVIDLTGLGGLQAVREAADQWRSHGTVPAETRARVDAALTRCELDAVLAHRVADVESQRVLFRKARGLACVAMVCTPGIDARTRFGEAVYEAASAMGGTAGLVGIIADFVP